LSEEAKKQVVPLVRWAERCDASTYRGRSETAVGVFGQPELTRARPDDGPGNGTSVLRTATDQLCTRATVRGSSSTRLTRRSRNQTGKAAVLNRVELDLSEEQLCGSWIGNLKRSPLLRIRNSAALETRRTNPAQPSPAAEDPPRRVPDKSRVHGSRARPSRTPRGNARSSRQARASCFRLRSSSGDARQPRTAPGPPGRDSTA